MLRYEGVNCAQLVLWEPLGQRLLPFLLLLRVHPRCYVLGTAHVTLELDIFCGDTKGWLCTTSLLVLGVRNIRFGTRVEIPQKHNGVLGTTALLQLLGDGPLARTRYSGLGMDNFCQGTERPVCMNQLHQCFGDALSIRTRNWSWDNFFLLK